nr:HAMP domain-containing sensor histidine kinase [Brevibacterium daeguense]
MLALVVDHGDVIHASRLDEDGDAERLSEEDTEVLSAIGAEALGDDDLVVRTVSLDVGRYLVQAEELGHDAVAITGLPTAPIAGTKASLAALQVLGSVAALLLAGLLGWWWIRRSLRPLGEVSRAAARVAEVPMSSGEVSLARCRIPEELARPADEVGAVGHALNRLIDSVDGAFEQRNRSERRLRTFVADASHELRTPLAGVRGYAEMIRMTEPLSERGKASLARVLQQADRMGSLVDDLLLLARLDSEPRIRGEQTDLGEVVVDAVTDASAAGREHRWTLDVPDHPVTVLGDRRQLAQLVANLLSNARKHTPAGTSVAVRLANGDGNAAESGTPVVRLSVEDDGPGIAQDLVPELFDRFVRGDAARSTTEGSTGLGLSIVRSIARAHGGDVTVESAPGRTVFTVQLPADSR